MRRAYVRVFEAIILLALVALLVAELPGSSFRLARTLNLKDAVENARRKVYPAVVRVQSSNKAISGTGVVISPDGMVVTHHRFVAGAGEVNCVLYDGRQVAAKLLGGDRETDLALLKLELPEGSAPLAYLEFANADKIRQGEFVLAVGSPFAFSRSIFLGIVSNTQRYLGFDTPFKYNNWIETGAAINVANDGGPLINMAGEVLGLNTVIASLPPSPGFAVPADVVQDVTERLKAQGQVRRAWLGLELQALKDFHSNTFAESDSGVVIAAVQQNSPAAQAGIQAGDILLKVNNEDVKAIYAEELPALRCKLADLPPAQAAKLLISREDEVQEFTVIPSLQQVGAAIERT